MTRYRSHRLVLLALTAMLTSAAGPTGEAWNPFAPWQPAANHADWSPRRPATPALGPRPPLPSLVVPSAFAALRRPTLPDPPTPDPMTERRRSIEAASDPVGLAPLWRRTVTVIGPRPIAVYRHHERLELRTIPLAIDAKESP